MTAAHHPLATQERLERLVVTTSALVAETSPEAVLDRVVQVAAEVIGARFAAIGVLAPEGRLLESFVTHGIDAELVPGSVPLRGDTEFWAWSSGRPVPFGCPTSRSPRFLRLSAASPADALLPRRADRGPAGRVREPLPHREAGAEVFSDEDEYIAVLLAAMTAAAVENARLHEESARLLEEVQQLHRAGSGSSRW